MLMCIYFYDLIIIVVRCNEKGFNIFVKKFDINEFLVKVVLIKKRFFLKVVGVGFKVSIG